MANVKTRAVFALGALDIARQIARAASARQEAERDRIGFGQGFREDAAQVARNTRERFPDHIDWRHLPPWRSAPTRADQLRTWGPIAFVILLTSAAVVVAARLIARDEGHGNAASTVTDSRMVGVIRAGSEAIDAGVDRVVSGGTAAATGTASAIAAGSSAVRTATVQRAKAEIDERVVAPAKKKAVLYGTLGVVGLTIYVIVIATIVQLVVGSF